MTAFLKKEWTESVRTGRLWVLVFIFALFGIMNPAIAKLTPWMMEIMGEQFAEAGIVADAVTVDAMTSWTQFYKNIPLALILFVLLNSGSFTVEYQKGTLIPVVTKGLSRRKIVAAKTLMLFGSWTALYLLCLGITYGYNEYFWDNGIASFWLFGALGFWLFGLWVIGWMIFFSTLAGSSIQVLFATGILTLGMYLLGLFPVLGRIFPARLMSGMSLLRGAERPEDLYGSILFTCLMLLFSILASFPCFDRKKL
ncbi:MAG: ABC transporter permease subunit [Lachnospiraceae bacterium]|nr:ABC transporter permease subunit [Lachnospiraceae bacterium]